MKKWELVVAGILALILGGGIILVFNGFPQGGDPQEPTDLPTAASTVGIMNIPTTYSTQTTIVSSNEDGRTVSPTLAPVMASSKTSVDIEDLLLLYSSEQPGSFEVNYCKIAEFYGLLCKETDLEKTEITDGLLRDASGKYYKLIGFDINNLQQTPGLLAKEEIDILKTAVSTGGTNMLIYNLNKRSTGPYLTELTDEAVLGVTVPQDSIRDWFVSTAAPEITGKFTGQTITSAISATQIDFALDLDPKATIMPLIFSKDDVSTSYLILARLSMGAGSIFLSAGAPAWGLDTRSIKDIYYDPSHFSEIVPLMLIIRYALGEEAWHNDHNYANLTLDGLLLTEPYQSFSFNRLLKEMKAHDFHTTIAFPPASWEKSDFIATAFFVDNPDRYSLVQFGNNADGYEFYKYNVSSDVQYLARPLADQEWDILEGLSRMETHKRYTGVSFDRVMIFPYGISPEATLVLLKKYNYLATVNAQNHPLETTPQSDREDGMAPVILNYGNFPLLTYRPPGSYQPFRPDIQPFLFDLFIGKPALMYSNVKALFASGVDTFNPVADQFNQLPGGVEWLGLGELIKRLHLEKVNDDGSVDIRMFTNDLILSNAFGVEKTYHISKEETLNVPILNITVNSQDFPYRFEDGFIMMDIKLLARNSSEIIIHYQEE